MSRLRDASLVRAIAAALVLFGCSSSDDAAPDAVAEDAGAPAAEASTHQDKDAAPIVDATLPPADAATTPDPVDGAPEAAARPTLPGIVLWLEASSGVTESGGVVTAWADQSGHHHDAAQTSAASQPSKVVVGGAAAIHFSGKLPALPTNTAGSGGTFLTIADAPDLNWGTDDFTLAVVARYQNKIDASHLGVIGTFYGKWGTATGQEGQVMFAGNYPYAEHPNLERATLFFGFGEIYPSVKTKLAGFNDNQVRLYVAERSSGNLILRVARAEVARFATPNVNVSSVGADVAIGSFGAAKSMRALEGDVFALVALKGTLSPTDLATLETYLVSGYATTPAPP